MIALGPFRVPLAFGLRPRAAAALHAWRVGAWEGLRGWIELDT